jgi:DNA-binding response OmpR family regulator
MRIRPRTAGEFEGFSDRSGLDYFLGDARCGPGPSPVMKGYGHHCVSLNHALRPDRGGLKASTGTEFLGEETDMATLLLLTNDMQASAEILPALELLPHQVKVAQAEATALLDAPAADVILLDARRDLVGARSLCRLIETTGKEAPLLVIAKEGGLAALSADWGFDDLLLTTAGPAEVDVRLRLAMSPAVASNADPVIQSGNIVIDEAGYSAKLNGVQLDLTYTEFELLKYLAQHPGRVFSRQQLLSDVWGYDYYGGTRTVDVHVRRLRAKLGPEYESVIGTVRNVGYRFVTPAEESARLSG